MARWSIFLCVVLFAAATWAPRGVIAGEPLQYGKSFTLTSKVLGEERNIWIHTPPGYVTPESRFPVLYLTDGPGHFLHTAGTADFLARGGRIPEMIIVGIANTDRTRDMTPTKLEAGTNGRPGFPTSGGADRFLKFIGEELIPHIDKHYRTEPYRVLAGHSFGGLLAVHAFLTHTDMFDAYLAVSPSLWWDDGLCQKRAKELFVGKSELNKSLFITLGNEGADMQTSFDELKGILAKQSTNGFQWQTQQFWDEDHGSVVLRSHYFGLKSIFEGWQLPQLSAEAGVAGAFDSMKQHYAKLSKRFNFEVKPQETMVNVLGYQVMGAGSTDEALAIFEYNVKLYPASANVYDSLGEAQEGIKKLDDARMNYKRAWELGKKNKDPNAAIYKTNFDRLDKKDDARKER